MFVIEAFILTIVTAIMVIPFTGVRWKGIFTITAVCLLAILSSIPAVTALGGLNTEVIFAGSSVTGEIPVRIDALSGCFILIINFTFLTGAFYGFHYMKQYRAETANIGLHCIAYLLVQSSLLSICAIQNSILFLFAWEIMALGSFLLVIFEHQKKETVKAGINFLVQAHVCILFLLTGFIWVASRMNTYDFKAITAFSTSYSLLTGIVLFFCFFIGFAIKAGFVPFHTWLPYAHPASPAHISGVMSGVIIKIGIYGILRMLLLIKSDYTLIGYIILFISVVTGIYGVMLAIIQHNLKKLLAYHSIENIGIIGIGIGLGCIGMGTGNSSLTILGFTGAILHTFNHSLFKSLLFYAAGNVYQSTHTMDIEKLGGLGKLMPRTSFLFLIAAIAICGLPPFNGFVSEFLIYNGMLSGFHNANLSFLSLLVFSLFGLVLIGGLAILCFTKAFGTVFSGTPRHLFNPVPSEAKAGTLVPMFLIMALMTIIGIYPVFFVRVIWEPVRLFTSGYEYAPVVNFPLSGSLSMISLCALGFFVFASAIYFIRNRITARRPVVTGPTWGCGYLAPNSHMQYTASSFIRSYRKLAEPVLAIHKKKSEVKGIFPKTGLHETHPYDKAEAMLIDYPLRQLKHFFNRFTFLQNGNPQFYILYGVVFITAVIIIPFAGTALTTLIHFFNQL